jgi:potassium efflux system protein
VNNFVSGLILLFERPLHVGDTIEVGDISGEVRRIGIRASTVRTFRGADIDVPNADLDTKQVTNWTLGDKLRSIDLSLGLNYGTDPEEVIQIFERVAKTHPDVLPSPAPSAFFTGYGDKSINFSVRAWIDKLDKFPNRPAFQGFASDGPSIMPLDRLQVILAIYCLTVPEKLY